MELSEKSLKVTIPVKAPMSSTKPEKEDNKEKEEEDKDNKEEKEEDGLTTPKGEEYRIPPLHECPPAPGPGIYRKKIEKRRKKYAGQRIISFNGQDLDTFFSRNQEVAKDS
ncbi:hypothetical protein CARUB_v10021182mg [Capsella rubella]|uniref:Uncharacterized protein n=1 Tax=Capsella rubella TaxID=81985 RepID=R0I146_9BRAS|nr:cyclin-dependent protein kinase inhibitor SMR4 [Capsella rubella]EOA35924.1 hypothetical protein CARUB_v10021182mg [Capsella rubella]